VKARITAIVMSVACFAYLGISSLRVVEFVRTGNWIGVGIAASSTAVIVVCTGLIIREIQFGVSMSRMAAILESEKALLADDLPKTVDGRIVRDAADARFDELRQSVERNPESWRAWYILAIAYDDARDRKRARGAMRNAERIFKSEFKA
jgi:hypothetical protein